ncbi:MULTISPECIES: ABC transporter permease [unclassified Streptomyces]|uniref:ABC transporter permease n=1 Tax=unclassified Streptomyces TaxID=2593676 RepID=UPI00158724D0|nr:MULTISPECIES: ABC transporter permease [unclassified Streptomyces]NUV67127.1 ABC transporter permease subunit [Streptomyces sp. CAI-121]NUW01052.1 ABC transporter permease subunit [Streptomyces sp. CAI 127]NUW13245.1 ABC transporter permease subunit [Streptomyces sp. CAI-68]
MSTDTSTGTVARADRGASAATASGAVSTADLLRSEVLKLTTTRLWWVLLLAALACSAGLTALIVFGGLNAPRSPLSFGTAADAVPAYNMAVALAYVFPLAIGVITVTQEYHARTISATLLAEPRRARVYAAKLLVGLGTAFVYGTVAVLSGALVSAALLSGHGKPTYLTDGAVLGALGGSIVVMTLWGAIGVGVGALVRNQVAAIVGILLVTQFLEPTLRILASSLGNAELGNLLPGGAGDLAGGGTIMTAAAEADGGSQGLGFLVLALYAVAIGAVGAARFTRYEAS